MRPSPPKNLSTTLLLTLLAITLACSACSRRASDTPDPEKSAAELQDQAQNIANESRRAIDEAEAALKQSAAKIDASIEATGASK